MSDLPGPIVRRMGPGCAYVIHLYTRQTNDSLSLLADSDGAGITSRLTHLLDMWSGVCGRPGSLPLARWFGRPDRPAARQQLTSPIPPDKIHTSAVSLPLALLRSASLVPHTPLLA